MTTSPATPRAISEEAIRPRALMEDKRAAVEADRRFLLDRRADWVDVACPACDQRDARVYGQKAGFTYVRCSACGTVYTNPRPSLALSHAFYAQSQNYAYWNRHVFPATAEVRRERMFRPRAERTVRCCESWRGRRPVLLEVGAAFGLFCDEARKLNFFDRIIALEPTPDLAETCRQQGFEVIERPLEDVPPNPVADVVAAFEVLEHVFDPGAFVQRCHALLRPGGRLILTCPNVEGFDVATLGVESGSFDHEHVNYFHTRSLPALLERHRFRMLEVSTPGQLDADIVRRRALAGEISLEGQPFLQRVLLDDWDRLGPAFQQFLADHALSSHLWVVAEKVDGNAAAQP